MTKKRHAERVTLEELLEYAAYVSRERKANWMLIQGEKQGKAIVSLSVYDYYAAFLKARGATDETAQRTQAWLADGIRAALGVGSTKTLSMRELANRIADAVNAPSLSGEDRWILYELCFLLTAEMRGERGSISWRDETVRLGTPDVDEPSALYYRIKDLHETRGYRPRQAEETPHRQSLEQVLQWAGGAKDEEWSSGRIVRIFPVDIFIRRFLAAKCHEDPSRDNDVQDQMLLYSRFREVTKTYTGREWEREEGLPFFTGNILTAFREKARTQDVPFHEVAQTYEFCYEFINLMADAAHSLGHRSLMLAEGLDKRFDYDELQEIEFEESVREMEAQEEREAYGWKED